MLNGPQQLQALLVKSEAVSELLGPKEPFVVLLPFAEFQFSQYVFGPVLFLLSIFIILIILLQRGRGGGLTGALGGAGGSSAFGVKAGDVFTKITAFLVLGWIVLCAFVCWFYLPPKLDIETEGGINTTSAGSMTVTGEGAASKETKPALEKADPPAPAPAAQGTEAAPPLPSSPPAEEPKKEDTPAPNGATSSLPPAVEPVQQPAPTEPAKLPEAEAKAEAPKTEGTPASEPATPVSEPPAANPEKPAETPPATPADTPSEPPKS